MSQQELLKKIIQALDQAEIPYMITGSIVSSLQGEPRSTHDIDILIAMQKSKTQILLGALAPFTDPLRVYEVQREKLDTEYLELWARTLDVAPLWRKVLNEAEIA
jgi:predicted nucleotidyltransferase